jgi:hypothetical protein
MGNKGLSDETVEKHESYGMVGINRVSSSGTNLFGSIATHQSFITLTVKRASVGRHLANDWYHAESRALVEIELSHSQFAELITSPGIGDGVPCTIRAFDGKMVEACPPPVQMESKYAEDLKKTTKETVAGLEELTQKLSQSLLPGEKPLNKTDLKALLGQIQSALSSITDSIPFIEKQFNEEMEVQRDKMVGEMEAVATHLIHNVGLKAIAATKLPSFAAPGLPQLPSGDEEK